MQAMLGTGSIKINHSYHSLCAVCLLLDRRKSVTYQSMGCTFQGNRNVTRSAWPVKLKARLERNIMPLGGISLKTFSILANLAMFNFLQFFSEQKSKTFFKK